MANLLQSLRRRGAADERRTGPWPLLPVDQWAQYFGFGGLDYGVTPGMSYTPNREEIGADLRGYVEGAYKANGVIFACILVRLLLFSEARFQFRQIRNGRPGDLFGTPALSRLERPWANGTTGDLLARMIQDVDLCGNSYTARWRNGLKRLPPDKVTIVMGADRSPRPGEPISDLDADLLGYAYHPNGVSSGEDPTIFLREEVAHFAPIPDPMAQWRGMSWLTPVIREILADGAATAHKLQFFENAATPNLVVIGKTIRQDAAERVQQAIRDRHAGVPNAYDTMVLGGIDDVKVVGADMRQIDFKVTQGHGETRIAAAAGVPPVIVGLSEGLDSATYSNYAQARRRLADGTMRPLWRNAAGSLASIVDVPSNAELWYDDRDVPFLQEDIKDAADIQSTEASTIRNLIEAGFDPDSVVEAVTSGDLRRLKQAHTGLVPVQLQPPGSGDATSGSGGPQPAGSGQNGRRLLEQFVGRP